jgi:hypothetical protein|tara:strand:- start:10 stop:246 length:237 start_codon:yes stop_codon:yes gene_type:complete
MRTNLSSDGKLSLTVIKPSILSGKYNTMVLDMTIDQYDAWTNGMLIQDAVPQLNVDEREFLKSGILPDEWDAMCGEED